MLRLPDIGILADDLTGACDVAACFAPVAGAVSVLVSGKDYDFKAAQSLEVINTQSRPMPAEAGRALLRLMGARLANKPVLFKKIDTALRGPVGAELQGLIEAIGPRRIVVAPALPRIGRTTRGGIQYANGVPIHKTAFSSDATWPVASADIAEVIRKTGSVQFNVRDAETDSDLLRIVDECLDGSDVVFVGSLGLADALSTRIEKAAVDRPDIRPSSRPMIACGSQYGRTLVQIETAASDSGAEVVTFDPGRTFRPERVSPATGRPLVLRIADQSNEPAARRPAEILSGFIAAVVGMIDTIRPDGLGIVGGQTAYLLMSQLGVSRLTVGGRMAEVIARGVMVDGTMAGCPIATKGGSVGDNDAVVQMFEYLMNPGGVHW